METKNSVSWKKIFIIATFLGSVALAVSFYLETKTDAYLSISNDNLAEQKVVIQNLLNGLKTGGDGNAGAVAVSDCGTTERIRFDELLARLSSLSNAELLELDTLFNSCAYYFATIQTVSAARLSREVAVYLDMLRAVAVLDTDAENALAQSDVWAEIVAEEKARSQLHIELVEIQRAIVDELLASKTASHPDVQILVTSAQEVRDNIIFSTQQIDKLRSTVYGS